jgi:hypothetical protein
MRNNRFISNEAQTYTAGCGFTGGFSARVYNTLFLDNTAGTTGTGNAGGASVFNGAAVDFFNCVFAGNSAPSAACMGVGAGSHAKLFMCISYENGTGSIELTESGNEGGMLEVYYSDVEGGEGAVIVSSMSELVYGEGNIDQDPLFAGTGEDPCQLTAGSPCIDAGSPEIFPWMTMPQTDIIGNIRVWDGGSGTPRIDMGAYEHGSEPMDVPTFQIPDSRFQIWCWPNPTNGVSSFKFQVPGFDNVSIKIYGLHGQEVMQVLDEKLPPGEHLVQVDMSGLPAGVYVVKATAGGEEAVNKKIINIQ